MESDSRWRHCTPILEKQPDAITKSWKRLVVIPSIVLGVCVVILLAISPPFVNAQSNKGPRMSITRLVIWSLLAAGLTATLTACRVFHKKKDAPSVPQVY